jgi:hypothetical protein
VVSGSTLAIAIAAQARVGGGRGARVAGARWERPIRG